MSKSWSTILQKGEPTTFTSQTQSNEKSNNTGDRIINTEEVELESSFDMLYGKSISQLWHRILEKRKTPSILCKPKSSHPIQEFLINHISIYEKMIQPDEESEDSYTDEVGE